MRNFVTGDWGKTIKCLFLSYYYLIYGGNDGYGDFIGGDNILLLSLLINEIKSTLLQRQRQHFPAQCISFMR